MKTIKHILVLMVIILIGTNAVAQEKEMTEGQKAQMEAQLEVFVDKLDLSEGQKPKFEEITERYGKQLMVLKESSKGRLSKYKAFKSINKERNEEMRALLSEEQFTMYLATQEEMQQKMRDNRNN